MQTELNKTLVAYGDCDCHAVTSFLPSFLPQSLDYFETWCFPALRSWSANTVATKLLQLREHSFSDSLNHDTVRIISKVISAISWSIISVIKCNVAFPPPVMNNVSNPLHQIKCGKSCSWTTKIL